ncbi:MAG: zeta toxin family protein [Thermoleophilia bacterium]
MNESATKPHVIVVAGPNGAGKSTSAPYFLRDALEVTEFVNADAIAGGLSAFSPESVAIAAGRIMLERMRELAADRTDFAFETTLAGRRLARFLADLQSKGYHVHVLFLGLESADLAVARVAERVRLGGHDVPVDTVRRRYDQGLRNLFRVYMPMADSWQYFDNSDVGEPKAVAAGTHRSSASVGEPEMWRVLKEDNGG